jgi:large subunit ribosomal protein L35
MPKMKTHRGAAKRFKFTPSGKIKRRRAFANHILEKKPRHRKRRLNSATVVSKEDTKTIRRLLGG